MPAALPYSARSTPAWAGHDCFDAKEMLNSGLSFDVCYTNILNDRAKTYIQCQIQGRECREVNNGIIGFGHLSLTVDNLEKALHFYRDLLGFKVLMERDKTVPGIGTLHVVSLGSPTGNMELICPPAKDGKQGGSRGLNWHCSFVTSDIMQTVKALTEEGYEFNLERLDYDPDWIDGKPVKSIHFTGPGGEHLELEEFE